MTQGDLPDEMMQQLTQAQFGQIVASAIAAMSKNRTSKHRTIFTGGCRGPKMSVHTDILLKSVH